MNRHFNSARREPGPTDLDPIGELAYTFHQEAPIGDHRRSPPPSAPRSWCFAPNAWGAPVITREIPETHPLYRLFRGLTEATFLAALGIGDPSLVGYVAGLLARFVPSEGVWSICNREGRRVEGVAQIVAEAEGSADDERRRECHRHVGDFTLFWTGMYPEALEKLQSAASADAIVNYREQGKRSYLLASTYSGEEATVFRRLSAGFELCAFGLSQVRREWGREANSGVFRGSLLVA